MPIPLPPSVASTGLSSDDTRSARSLADVLYGLFQQEGSSRIFRIAGEGFGSLFLFLRERKFYIEPPLHTLPNLNGSTPVRHVEVSSGEDALVRLLAAQPWRPLLQRAGLYGVRGELLPQIERQAAYRLKRWPTIDTVDSSTRVLIKVAAYLMKHAGTLQEIVAATQVAPGDVADALNACALCGCLASAPRESAAATLPARLPANTAKRTLFNRIRAKLWLVTLQPAVDG